MQVLIVDNENNILEGLKRLIQLYCPQVSEIMTASKMPAALTLIKENKFNVVFLDVELDEGSGMDLLAQIDEINFQLIFITAYDHYALEAIKLNAIDYLLKPIDPDDLVLSIEKAERQMSLNEDQEKLQKLIIGLNKLQDRNKKLIVNDRENVYAIEIESIFYLEADGPYTRIVKEDSSLYVSKNLKYFENLLSEAGFFRTHHSYLTNLNHLKQYNKSMSQVELKNGMRIPVSVRKKERLFDLLKNSTIGEA